VYDEFGKQSGKFSEKDFEDVYAGNDFSLFEDSRVKHYIPAITTFPYTIVYEYEVRSKQTLTFYDWAPNPNTGLSVEKSSYTFTCAPDFNIRYKEINIPTKVVTGTNKDGRKTYTWQIDNLKAVRDEPYSPNRESFLSQVKIAPEKFSYEGIAGSFTNWQELGKWIYDKLLTNRTVVSAETAQHMKDLTNGIADPKAKAKKIYGYMQQKTRYISVQIGIGGFQPFLASEVDQLNYGDCKALVNYTQALLKTVNIDSYYCVVESGSRKVSVMSDFASMDQCDHVILCIPFKNDTTWVECTSQKIPFGFLSDFTDDRTVLACTPEGGKLLHTSRYDAKTNLETRKANFVIDNSGTLSGDMTTTFKGTQYDEREALIGEGTVERLKIIQKIYPINNMAIEQLDLQQEKLEAPVTTEKLKFNARDYATANDGKLNFFLNPANRVGSAPREVRNRINPVHINRGYTDEDEITYTLPKGYHLEKPPLNVLLNKPFGSYTVITKVNNGQLTYKRNFQLLDGTYSKDTYQDLVDFYQTVVDYDHYYVGLVKD
jgi:hypothetical protein